MEVKVGDEAALSKATQLTEELYGQSVWRDNDTRIDAGGFCGQVTGSQTGKIGRITTPSCLP